MSVPPHMCKVQMEPKRACHTHRSTHTTVLNCLLQQHAAVTQQCTVAFGLSAEPPASHSTACFPLLDCPLVSQPCCMGPCLHNASGRMLVPPQTLHRKPQLLYLSVGAVGCGRSARSAAREGYQGAPCDKLTLQKVVIRMYRNMAPHSCRSLPGKPRCDTMLANQLNG